MESRLGWYLASSGLFVIPGGIGQVLLPWLLTVYLNESATRIGLAQMLAQVPVVFLILWGGWLGDRVDQRRLLVLLITTVSLPPLILAATFHWGTITYELIVAYSILMGGFMAFIQPARDALLNRVAGEKIQEAVTVTIGLQWGIQILGFGIGSAADLVGPIILCFIISLFMLGSAFTTKLIPVLPLRKTDISKSAIAQIREGLQIAWQDVAIRTAIIQIFALAIFYSGAYLVLLPIMVRDLYGGGSLGLGGGFAANLAGTVLSTLLLMRYGRVRYPGRALTYGVMLSCCVLLGLTTQLPTWLFYLVVFLWGAGGGVIVIMSRSIVQECAPETHRARVMSIFSLGLMGGSPLGSLMMGLLIDDVGVYLAVLFPVVGMTLVSLILFFKTPLWVIESKS